MQRSSASYPNFADWRDQNHVFEHMASYYNNDFIMTGRGESTRLQGAVVNADLFPLLGVAPSLGRGFLPDEDKPGEGGRVVILSQELFQKRFNSDPNVINQSMVLTENPSPSSASCPTHFSSRFKMNRSSCGPPCPVTGKERTNHGRAWRTLYERDRPS